MFSIKKSLLIGFIFLSSIVNIPIFALEKERLVTFLKEYDASKEKFGGKVGYAIEKGFPDVAEFLILKGESIYTYQEDCSLSPDPSALDKLYQKYGSNFVKNIRELKDEKTYVKHPLTTAIRSGYKELSIFMILNGYGNTAEEYNIERQKIIFKEGTYRTNFTESEKKNAMSIAINECYEDFAYEIVLNLILSGFDINLSRPLTAHPINSFTTGHTLYLSPLLQAIAIKKTAIIELLLENGADVENYSPLSRAVEDNFIEGVVLLLRHGADPLKGSPSSLEKAIQKGYLDIVDVLLDATMP